MHWSQRRWCRKIVESPSFPKMYYSMPINMFFIVKIHWEPYFVDDPRILGDNIDTIRKNTETLIVTKRLVQK
jgi:hypothetical protein